MLHIKFGRVTEFLDPLKEPYQILKKKKKKKTAAELRSQFRKHDISVSKGDKFKLIIHR